jgi:hypothetical protein
MIRIVAQGLFSALWNGFTLFPRHPWISSYISIIIVFLLVAFLDFLYLDSLTMHPYHHVIFQ